MIRLALATLAVAVAAPIPAWIGRAVPPPIVKAVEVDVLGTSIPEGIAISKAGGTYFVGVADSRLDPPEMVLEYDLVKAVKGSSLKSLAAGKLTGEGRGDIAVVLRLPSGERAWILRVEPKKLRLLRSFSGDTVTVSGAQVKVIVHGPKTRYELWRFQSGKYQLIAQS